MNRSLKTQLVALAFLLCPVTLASAQSADDADATLGQAPAAVSPADRVNLNTATVEQLIALPGIGPSRAQAIVELREKIGGFKKVDDLMRVKGIGRKTFRKLEPMLKL